MANVIRVPSNGQTIGAVNLDLISYTIPSNTVCICRVLITGHTSAMDVITFDKQVTFKNVAGIVSIVGGTNFISPHKDSALSAAAMVEVAVGASAKFVVTGVATKTINWRAVMEMYWDN